MEFALGVLGLHDDHFWSLTPYELHLRMKGWKTTQETSRLRSIYQAWQTAAYSRAKRLPSLRRVLNAPKPRRLGREELERRQRELEEAAKRAGVSVYDGTGKLPHVV